MSDTKIRVVLLTTFLPNHRMFASWADRHGHEIVLVVSTPQAQDNRYGGAENSLVGGLPKGSSLLVTGKLRTVAAPVIAAMEPDLLISAAFPRLIPPEILALPKYGALNLHPTALPAGRGPNPVRLVYDGADTIGATLHRTAAEFDTGALLSVRERPLPADLTGPALLAACFDLFEEVIEEGTARALAGEPGTPQDESLATEARPFTDEERLLDLTGPTAVIRRKTAALNVLSPTARVLVDGREAAVREVYEVAAEGAHAPGTVLAAYADGWTVRTADGAVRVVLA